MKREFLRAFWFGSALTLLAVLPQYAAAKEPMTSPSEPIRVYVGTYTDGQSKGVYLLELDRKAGKFSEPQLVAETKNPTFLAIHPSRKYLYAVSEVLEHEGRPTGSVTAYEIDVKSGKLKELNREITGGTSPCHVVVDPTGKNLLVANYSSGSAAALPIAEDGSLKKAATVVQHEGSSANKSRQEGPHAHSANLDASGKLVVVADLGIDKLMLYQLDPATGKLSSHKPEAVKLKPGAGPRHFTFHPNGKFAYVINELDSTVTALKFDAADGKFEELQTIATLPDDFTGSNTTAEVQVHPSGKFLYGSNRGHDSIVAYKIGDDGRLTLIGHEPSGGKTPRNFGIEPTGTYMLSANQDTDNILLMKIDSSTGRLTPTDEQVKVGRPVCIKFFEIAK